MVFVGKYCGYTKPKPVASLTNHLTVYFDTNDRKTDQGFKAHYKAVAPELAPGKKMSGNPFQQENFLGSDIMLDVCLYKYMTDLESKCYRNGCWIKRGVGEGK